MTEMLTLLMFSKLENHSFLNVNIPIHAFEIILHEQIGSIFEYNYKNPIFGIVDSSSPLYTPILAIFALTGIPMAGFLFKNAVDGANKMAEYYDKQDGF